MMYSKTMRGFFVILFVVLSHFMAKTQSSIVIDKGVFMLTPSCFVKTDLVTLQNPSKPYSIIGLSNYLFNYSNNNNDVVYFNNNYIFEIILYDNSTHTTLGTLTIYNLSGLTHQYNATLSSTMSCSDIKDIIENPNLYPQVTYTLNIWRKQCITALVFVDQTACPNNTSLAREGVIRVTPSNIPVRYERIDANNNVIWHSGSYSTVPFRTTISGNYIARRSSGETVYSPIPIVFTNLGTCPKSTAAPNGNLVTSPNPALSQLHIDYQMSEEGTLDISIVDISGKEVIQVGQQLKVSKGYYQTNIDINHLAKGLYFVHVFDGKETSIQKIVKTE